MTLVLRPPQPDDLPLIAQTYARGARRCMRDEDLRSLSWPELADRFVAACVLDGCVLVAGWEASDVVMGYALGCREGADRAVLHWVHVKAPYQRRGIATRLVGALCGPNREVTVTHAPAAWQRRLVRNRGWRVAERLPWLWLLTREAKHGEQAA